MAGKFNIKCGVINPDGQINQDIGFKFFTWTATSNAVVENQATLAERVRDLYPEMTEPYQIVCIGNKFKAVKNECIPVIYVVFIWWISLSDETNERVVLQADDFKETIAAFLCLKSKNDQPVRICIQPLSFIQSALSDEQGHYGVVCCGCHRRPIIGFRYDCTQCPNYVLCARCQAAGVHREHSFVRINQPPVSMATILWRWNKYLTVLYHLLRPCHWIRKINKGTACQPESPLLFKTQFNSWVIASSTRWIHFNRQYQTRFTIWRRAFTTTMRGNLIPKIWWICPEIN